MKMLLAALSIATLLTGCAATIDRLKGPEAQLKYSDYAGAPVSSFWISSFEGWAPVDKNQLAVHGDINKVFLVTVSGYCPNLEFARRIGITSTGSNVDKFDKVIVDHVRCLISEIRPVDMVKMKADAKALKQQAASANHST